MDGVMTLDKTRQQKQIICFYPGTIGGGGIARVFFNLIQTMLNDGIEVHLFLNNKSGNLYSQIPEGTKVFFGNGSVKNSLLPLLKYLHKYKPQALITAHAHVNIAAIVITKLALVPTKLVATIHTATSRDDKAGKPLRKKLNTISSRLIYPLADEIIAVSDAVADDLAKYLKMKRSRIKTIYNPVVTQKLLRLSQEKAEHPYFEQDKPVLISVGRLSEQKDFPNLINAFAVVKKEIDAKLIILGEGEDRAALEKQIKDLKLENDIDLAGFVDNPYAFMAASRLFVSSSAWEGLPTVLIEAMAAGTNVVATDCPGGTAEILENGKYGKLVPVADSKALAKAIISSLNKPISQTKVLKRAKEFSDSAATEQYLKLLEDRALSFA